MGSNRDPDICGGALMSFPHCGRRRGGRGQRLATRGRNGTQFAGRPAWGSGLIAGASGAGAWRNGKAILCIALAALLAGCGASGRTALSNMGPGADGYDFKAARRDCISEMAQRNLPQDVINDPGGRSYISECMRARGFDLAAGGPIPSDTAGAAAPTGTGGATGSARPAGTR
jgi:hypothetical protein